MAWLGGQYTLTASAANISTILSLAAGTKLKQLTIKNAKGAANPVYLGGSTVTNAPANAFAEIDTNTQYTIYPSDGWLIDPTKVYIVGTVNAANIAFISYTT